MDYNYRNTFFKKYKSKSNTLILDINIDYYRLIALKELIDIFINTNMSWQYTISKNHEHHLRLICENIQDIRWINFKDINIDVDLSVFSIHVYYDINNYNKIYVETYIKNTLTEINDLYIKEMNNINEYIYNEIVYIYNQVLQSTLIPNYCFQKIELRKGDFIGYYDFDWIKIDCGRKITNYCYPRIVKCKFKYFKILLENFKYPIPCIETIDINRKIIFSLIQLFLRCSISFSLTDGEYFNFPNNENINNYNLDTRYNGEFISLKRGNINNEYYDGIPSDTQDLINKFYELDYEKQNLFIISCNSYCDAQKSSSYGKAVTLYTIALENIANHTYKSDKIGKKQKIYLLLRDIFGRELVSKDFVSYFYDIRCLYAHRGISNNGIKQEIFSVEESDSTLELSLEEITYSALVQWLINQKKGE